MNFWIKFFFIVIYFATYSFADEKSEPEVFEVETAPPAADISFLDKLFNKFGDEAKPDLSNEITQENTELRLATEQKEGAFQKMASLRVIDKTLGKLYNLEIEVGSHKEIKGISIKVLKCWAPFQKTLLPEGKALLQISEFVNGKPIPLFYGWMFAQSASSSQLTHPKFDITLDTCKGIKTESNNSSDKQENDTQINENI